MVSNNDNFVLVFILKQQNDYYNIGNFSFQDNNKRPFVSFTFEEPFQLSSDNFEDINNINERRNFGFLDANRKAVFGQITADGKTVQIYTAKNEMYDLTISRRNGDISTIMARLKRLENRAFCLNDAYIIEERQIRNKSISVPPNLDRRSAYLNIELVERASMSIVKIGFDNNEDRMPMLISHPIIWSLLCRAIVVMRSIWNRPLTITPRQA